MRTVCAYVDVVENRAIERATSDSVLQRQAGTAELVLLLDGRALPGHLAETARAALNAVLRHVDASTVNIGAENALFVEQAERGRGDEL